jgi:O-antigen/teichoic acid export membrane protein
MRLSDVFARLVGARILGPDDQGVLEVLIAWIATGIMLTSGGFATAASIHVSDTRDPDERQTIFSVGTLGILAGWGLLATTAISLLLTTSWIPPTVGRQIALVLALILLAGFGDPRFGLLGLVGMGLKRYSLVGRQRLLVGCLYFVGWVVGAALGGVQGALIGWAVAVAVGALYAMIGLPLTFHLRVTVRARARTVCRHAWQCLGNQMSGRLNEYLSVFLLVAYGLSQSAIGNFGVAMAAARTLLIIPAMLANLALPYLVSVHRDRAQHLRLSRTLFWAIVLVTVGSWLGLSLAGRYLLPAMLPRFGQAEALFQVLAVATVIGAFCTPLGTRFLSLHLPSWNLVVNILAVLALPSFAILWIPRYGVCGLGYAWCAVTFLRISTVLGLTLFECRRPRTDGPNEPRAATAQANDAERVPLDDDSTAS